MCFKNLSKFLLNELTDGSIHNRRWMCIPSISDLLGKEMFPDVQYIVLFIIYNLLLYKIYTIGSKDPDG